MPNKAMKTKRLPVNPNWLQLQEKLKSQGFRARKPSIGSETGTLKGVLGKRKERSDEDEESNDSPTSVLTPINSDSSVTDEIAMDCEMVGVSSQGNKSALGRVSVVNMWGNVIYDEFVRPVERVVDYRTEISGIRPRDLRKAKDFQVVQKDVSELINGKILVGHALRNDLKALLLSHPKNYTRDTSEFHSFLKEGRKRSLRSLADEFLNVKIQDGEHCPIQDAQAAMLLYQKNKKEWERGIKNHLRLKGKNKGKRPKKSKVRAAGNIDTPELVT